eukprot:3495872-Alexandrium_andersonii.AAC.1
MGTFPNGMKVPRESGVFAIFTRTYCFARERERPAAAAGGGMASSSEQTAPADGGGALPLLPARPQRCTAR